MLAQQVGMIHRAEWLAKGYIQGQRDLLLRQFEHRFGPNISQTLRARIALGTPESIEQWSQNLLTATDARSVFE
jgi:hypothetical protein